MLKSFASLIRPLGRPRASAPGRLVKRLASGPSTLTEIIRGNRDWSRFGVRDPSILLDREGRPWEEEGCVTVFFNGRDRPVSEGGRTRVGRARLSLASGSCDVLDGFVFEDGDYAAQGCVLRLADGDYRMFYSDATDRGFRCAQSGDGLKWSAGRERLLEPGMFGCTRIGLPYVFRHHDQWVMYFEGIRDRRFGIFGASSKDGEEWTPLDAGAPLLARDRMAWDGGGQANPSVVQMSDLWLLFYNGHAEDLPFGWQVGVATTADPLSPSWKGIDSPIIARAGTDWAAGRVEGARLLRATAEGAEIVFFGLPTRDSYAGGSISLARFNVPAAGEQEVTMSETPNAMSGAEDNAEAETRFNDKLAQTYFSVWDSYPIQKYTQILEGTWMAGVVKSGEHVLLAGSGGGREIAAIDGIAARIVALDISPEMLRVGRERFPGSSIEWVLGDVQAPPGGLGTFHHAFALGGVYAYLPEPERATRAIFEHLEPGGTLTVCVMNAAHPTETSETKHMSDGRIRRAFEVKALSDMMTASGFEVERCDGFRFIVDLLPPEWNRAGEAGPHAKVMDQALELEEALVGRLQAERGKFIWITARKPAR